MLCGLREITYYHHVSRLFLIVTHAVLPAQLPGNYEAEHCARIMRAGARGLVRDGFELESFGQDGIVALDGVALEQ